MRVQRPGTSKIDIVRDRANIDQGNARSLGIIAGTGSSELADSGGETASNELSRTTFTGETIQRSNNCDLREDARWAIKPLEFFPPREETIIRRFDGQIAQKISRTAPDGSVAHDGVDATQRRTISAKPTSAKDRSNFGGTTFLEDNCGCG